MIAADEAPRLSGPGLRQSMSSLHTWVGLLVGWFLYAMFITGTVSYFKDELSQWMRPELPHQSQVPDPAVVAQRMVEGLAEAAPDSSQWSFRMPDERNNSVYAFWRSGARGQGPRQGRGQTQGQNQSQEPGPAHGRGQAAQGQDQAQAREPGEAQGRARSRVQGGQAQAAPPRAFGEGNFDPRTGRKVASRDTLGGDFFYRFHFQFHYMPAQWGRWIAGICAMFMLVAIISGVITHKKIFIDFFTFRWGKGQRSWLDAHNALSVFGLPFHAMITYTGLVTLMAMYMPWGEQAAFKTPAERQQIQAELSAFIPPGKPTREAAPLAPIADMVKQAQARWGEHNISRVTITLPGDAASRVAVARGEQGRVSMSPQYMLFEGATGKLLEVKDSVGGAAETRGVLYALHLGRFSDSVTRWLYFFVSLAGTAMVGTGLVMWTVKRRQKLPDPERPHIGFRIVERLNIASVAGISISMVAYLWGNRLLPLGIAERGQWEIHLFFAVWALTLIHALLRPARKAWIEQLWLGAALLALLPVLNALLTSRGLWPSLATGDWIFAGIDLMCLALAALHVMLAIRTARHRPRVRQPRPADRAGMFNAKVSEEGA